MVLRHLRIHQRPNPKAATPAQSPVDPFRRALLMLGSRSLPIPDEGGGSEADMHTTRRAVLIGSSATGAALISPWALADPLLPYRWQPSATEMLATRFPAPAGFQRVAAAPGSFAAWLRGLPLKPAGAPVLLYNGAPKFRQDVHAAVIDIDVGTRDLQQCADATMPARQWLYAMNRPARLPSTTRARATDRLLALGRQERPHLSGRSLSWSRGAVPYVSYSSFRRYMDVVFIWAGTHSLERELAPRPVAQLAAGDLFIKGGFPGHAVLVADVVENRATGERRFLLVQSFMPAQEMHVLKNPANADGSPLVSADLRRSARYARWTFTAREPAAVKKQP
jgi:hypothetical protein